MQTDQSKTETLAAVASSDLLYRIRARSVMGWPVWVTKVSEPIDTGEGSAPIVSMVNRLQKGKRFRREEAEALLPQVHTSHPEAEIVAAPDMPRIVCLCGSTRFVENFNDWRKKLTHAGIIVLSIEIVTTQARHEDPQHTNGELKAMLDELHKRKIDLANEIMVLNVGGYIGDSTRAEIEYAEANGKPVRYLEAV